MTQPGELCSFDIWTCGVGHMHGGQKYVIGFHDHYSGLDKDYLLHRKSDAASAIKLFVAFCHSHNVTVRRLHTDNAPEFHIAEVKQLCALHKIRLTSCAPNEPRGNGVMERRWRIKGNQTRPALLEANFPPPAWWYAFRNATHVRNCTPNRHGVTPWFKFTGKLPSVAAFRVLGSLAYYKVVKPSSKMHARARRAINLGRCEDQPGYWLYDDGQIVCTPHVRFVESVKPGFSKTPGGGEPSIAEIEKLFNGGNGASTASGGADGPQDSPDDHAPLNPEGPESVSGESSDDAEVSDSDSDEVSESTAGPTPARISGRLTRRSKYRSGTTAGACVDVPEQGGFFLYVGSGPLWENSVSAHVLKMTGQHVVSVDLKVGGYNHDISSPPVAKELRRLADDPRCLGVLGSIPCKTYSPARSAPATGALIRSKPLRDDKNPLGHRDAQGNLPTVVHRANEAAQLLADMCAKVHRRGKPFVVETTPSRGRDAAFPLPGRDDHVGMLDMPSFRDLAKATGARTTHFDQCMTRDDPTTTPEKKTVLFYSAAWHPIVQSQFAHLMCSHGPGSHPSMLGMADDGTARSSKWENYSGVMNERLARCLTWSPPAQPAAGLVPIDDWATFYNQSHVTYKDDSAGVEKNVVAMLASVVAYVGDAFSRQLYDTCVDEQCFAAPRTANSDSPTLRQAMEGPDRDLWAASRQNEYENFTRHEVFEPVLEDTLSTWNIIKKVATEVVPLLEVMVKKYIDSVFHKCKTRWVVDGSRQKFENARAEHPLDTFAPTVRHSTHKPRSSQRHHERRGSDDPVLQGVP